MAVNPDPRTLLLPDPDAIPSFLRGKTAALFGSFLGLTTALAHRYISRRPVLSGIQLHVFAIVTGGVVGKYFEDRRERYNMDRDAMYRHYIELHPEDFPAPERKRVGEVFRTWAPVR